jgi:hypothetical protein
MVEQGSFERDARRALKVGSHVEFVEDSTSRKRILTEFGESVCFALLVRSRLVLW